MMIIFTHLASEKKVMKSIDKPWTMFPEDLDAFLANLLALPSAEPSLVEVPNPDYPDHPHLCNRHTPITRAQLRSI